jgi:glutathione S-transferase
VSLPVLIGQYDSPFVRRVGIAMRLYGMAFRHEPWSVFGDAERIAALNPLRRVPTLVLADGTALVDSAAILDTLDDMVGRERALFPSTGTARRDAVRIAALAAGLGDKAVSLFYERRLHDVTSELWETRCRQQIGGTLDLLEAAYAGRPGPWWGGDDIGHADIAVAAVWRFLGEAHPGLIEAEACPALSALSARAEALAVFREISQPFRTSAPER